MTIWNAVVETEKLLELLNCTNDHTAPNWIKTANSSMRWYIQRLASSPGGCYTRGDTVFSYADILGVGVEFHMYHQSVFFKSCFGLYTLLRIHTASAGHLENFYKLLRPLLVADDAVNQDFYNIDKIFGVQPSQRQQLILNSTTAHQVITQYAYGHQKYEAFWHMWKWNSNWLHGGHTVFGEKISQLLAACIAGIGAKPLGNSMHFIEHKNARAMHKFITALQSVQESDILQTELTPTGMGLDTISFDAQDPIHFALFNTQNMLQALDAFSIQGYISPDQLHTTKTHLEHLKHFPKYCYVEGLGGTMVIPLNIDGVNIQLVIDFSAQVFVPYLPYLSHLIVAVYCTDFDLPQNQAALNILYNTAQLEFGFLQPYNQSPFTWTNDDPRLLCVDYNVQDFINTDHSAIDWSEETLKIATKQELTDMHILAAQQLIEKGRHPLDAEFFWREDGDPHPPFWSYTQSQHIVLGAKLAKHLNLGNGVYWPTASEAPHIHQQLAQVTVEDIFEVIGDFDSI